MAKRLLLGILEDLLGKYVDGLTTDNLQVGIWSGKLEFNNLELKRSSLDSLNLPVTISHGTLKQLKAIIPWTALDSKPVRIMLDGIYLQAAPVDISQLDIDVIKEELHSSKREKLNEAEKLLIDSSIEKLSNKNSSFGSGNSFIQRIAMKIIDNIEISITNIHIRYEDKLSFPNKCFSFGITISSIKLTATDENWNEAFVIRKSDSVSDSIVHKLGKLDNLGIYWNIEEKNPLDKLGSIDWNKHMQLLIFSTSSFNKSSLIQSRSYILHPDNHLYLRIIHRSRLSRSTNPMVDIVVESSTLNISYDFLQHQQVLSLITLFSQMERYKLMMLHRPNKRPTESPREWWKYAYKLVVGKDISVKNPIESMLLCHRYRTRYIELIKKARIFKLKNGDKVFPEDNEISKIEDILPFASLLLFRKIAIIEMFRDKTNNIERSHNKKAFWNNSLYSKYTPSKAVEYHHENPEMVSKQNKKSSLRLMFLFGKKEKKSEISTNPIVSPRDKAMEAKAINFDDEEEDALLIKKFEDSLLDESSSIDDDDFPLRFTLSTSSVLTVYSSYDAVVELSMMLNIEAEIRKLGLQFSLSLNDMKVEDKFSEFPVEKYILRPRGPIDKSSKQLHLRIENTSGSSSMSISAVPFDITFNPDCFEKIFDICFYIPSILTTISIDAQEVSKTQYLSRYISKYTKDAQQIISAAVNNSIIINSETLDSIYLVIEIQSPTIIIPKNYKREDEGYLILDCGNVILNGTIGIESISLEANVKAINIGMPQTFVERDEMLQKGLYLVRPFDVSFIIQNVDRSAAEMTLIFKISPSIEADIDLLKIRLLMYTVMSIINTLNASFANLEKLNKSSDNAETILIGKEMKPSDTLMSTDDDFHPFELMNVSERRKDLLLVFEISAVVLNITISNDQYIRCAIDKLSLSIITTLAELKLDFYLQSISILDSFRPVACQTLLWTPNSIGNEESDEFIIDDNFCTISLMLFATTETSAFEGYGTDITLAFTKLCLDLDHEAILRLCPFLAGVLQPLDETSDSKSILDASLTILSTSTINPFLTEELNAIRLKFSVRSIDLCLLQPEASYERYFNLTISNFFMNYESTDLGQMTMTLKDLDIIDARRVSSDNFYKKIFSRSPNQVVVSTESNAIQTSTHSNTRNEKDLDDLIFKMKFIQETLIKSNIHIEVKDITSFISPDSLMDFIDILMANINGIVALIAAITSSIATENVDKANEDEDFIMEQDKSTKDLMRSDYFQISLYVAVKNPRLLVLEDLMFENSQAMVCRCGVEFQYDSDVETILNLQNPLRTNKIVKTKEYMNICALKAEVFLMDNVTDLRNIHQLFDPSTITIALNRELVCDEIITTKLSLMADELIIRLSFHDLIFSNSIIHRTTKKLALYQQSMKQLKDNDSKIRSRSVSSSNPSNQMVSSVIMNINIALNVRKFQLTLINDYSGCNLPVLNLQVLDICSIITGPISNLHGEFSLMLISDYYNNKVTSFEPFIEPWTPVFKLSTNLNGISIDIINKMTLQINISGAFVQNIVNCLDLLNLALEEKIDYDEDKKSMNKEMKLESPRYKKPPRIPREDRDRHHRRKQFYPITFVNSLGVPIEIFEYQTKVLIASLSSSGQYSLAKETLDQIFNRDKSLILNFSRSRSHDSIESLPRLYDVKLGGMFQHVFLPLSQLPLLLNQAQYYYLQIRSNSINDSRPAIGEGVVKEIAFQNSRFNVVKQKWTKPWYQYGDPNEWTDVDNNTIDAPSDRALPSDEWEWINDWHVDMSGVVNKNIDAEGYEYNINFNNFGSSSVPRSFMPLDSVRRRKWIRSRRLKNFFCETKEGNEKLSEVQRGVVWDVRVERDGTRRIHIRSSSCVKNSMVFAIDIRLSGFSNEKPPIEYLNIQANESYFIPLESMDASLIEVRPHIRYLDRISYDWSTPLQYKVQKRKDSSNIQLYYVDCMVFDFVEAHDEALQSVFMRAVVDISSKRGVNIEFLPLAIVHNHLPASCQVKCESENDFIQNLDVKSANKSPIYHIHPMQSPSVSFLLGNSFLWSRRVSLNKIGLNYIEMKHKTERGELLNLSLDISCDKTTGLIHLIIYSKFALIDRTGLSLSIRTRKNDDTSGSDDIEVCSSVETTPERKSITSMADVESMRSGEVRVQNTIERRTYGKSRDGENSYRQMITHQFSKLLPEDILDSSVSEKDLEGVWSDSWIEGNNGVVLFQSQDDKALIGINRGSAWSFTIHLVSIGSSKNAIEVYDKKAQRVYQLAFSLSPMEYIFSKTTVVTVYPWYRIFNCMDTDLIQLKQFSGDFKNEDNEEHLDVFTIGSMKSVGWHRSSSNPETRLHFKCINSLNPHDYTLWSFGAVDINDIGTSTIILPGPSNGLREKTTVIHVEVKFAEAADLAYMTILIWKETNEAVDNWTMSINNTSSVPVTVRQDVRGGILGKLKGTDRIALTNYEVNVQPGIWKPFGWIDTSYSSRVVVTIGNTLYEVSKADACVIDFLVIGKEFKLKSEEGLTIRLRVNAVGSSKVLHISQDSDLSDIEVAIKEGVLRKNTIPFTSRIFMYLSCICISFIAERPERREFFVVYIDEVECSLVIKNETRNVGKTTSLEFRIKDIQVDNYSESAIYPVLIHSFDSNDRKRSFRRAKHSKSLIPQSISDESSDNASYQEDVSDMSTRLSKLDFLSFAVVQETPLGMTTPIFKYIALRVLELKIALDSSTIQLYLLDIHDDLIGNTSNNDSFYNLSSNAMNKYVHEYNQYLTFYSKHPLDAKAAKKFVQGYKLYVEELVIHPLKFSISFMTSSFPRNRKQNEDVFGSSKFLLLQLFRGIAGVEEMTIRVTSFIVKNVMETQDALISRILYKLLREIQFQILEIAGNLVGSLNVLGKPAGFVKNIGSGVEDFFYEPYQGLMESPEAFFAGVGRGTGSLLNSVVIGALSSAVTMVGTASMTLAKGATLLSGDDNYSRQREEKRRELAANGGGIIAGLKAGGESILSGFTSGVTGLLTKPIEETRKSGAIGTLKGIGLGIVGIAAKPILGISEGVASISQGVTNQMSHNLTIAHVRPPRAFIRSELNPSELVLVIIDLEAAMAQKYVMQWAKKADYKDKFVGFVHLGFQKAISSKQQLVKNQEANAIIISEKFIFLIREDGKQLWKCPWRDVSHCEFIGDFNEVKIELSQSMTMKANTIVSSSSLDVAIGGSHMNISCFNASITLKVYMLLIHNSHRMSNPFKIIPIEMLSIPKMEEWNHESKSNKPKSNESKSNESTKRIISKYSYRFGSMNDMRFTKEIHHRSLSIKEILINARERFFLDDYDLPLVVSEDNELQVVNTYLKAIDQSTMELIFDWQMSKFSFPRKKCIVGIFINNTNIPIHIHYVEVMEGKTYEMFSVRSFQNNGEDGFDSKSRVIASNGGCVVIFGMGRMKTLVDIAHVQLKIQANAFTSIISSRPVSSSCEGLGGYHAGFIEKSLTKAWGKFVILIK